MLLSSLLLTPILGVLAILINRDNGVSLKNIKFIALTTSILNFFISLIIFIIFDFSTNQFQFVQEYHEISYFDFYLGVDGLSIYFILLTTIIIPISLVSNWKSITRDVESYVIIILLLETLLLAVFLVLDILLFYIFFESILPPLFILIGIFGSDNRVKASFYLFLYTLLGSLFLLLSILAMSSIMSTTDFDTLFKGNFIYLTQLFLFYGIFIAFAVKTPTIFLNTWLLKAHVESPLGGSIILAAIVLKLSLYGILRLILPILPKAYMEYTYIIFLIGVITIVYASLSTLRTIDVKELIAYSSVSHAAVYLLGVFSNSIQGIEGAINLGLAHGLVSPGLFICAGGVLYDRSSTRIISFYRGVTQVMPLFAILFFILCLANCGAPLSLNFVGEFLSLYGVFERSSLFGIFASSSIVFSAAYTIYMYQRIAFGGCYSRMFTISIPDLTKREFTVLFVLVIPTVFFGIYPAPILDAIHYSVSTLIYCFDFNIISCDAPRAWGLYFQDSASPQMEALVELHDNIMYYLVAILFSVGWIKAAIFGYTWTIGPLFSNILRILNDRSAPGLEWELQNPPKPHGFTSFFLESTGGPRPGILELMHESKDLFNESKRLLIDVQSRFTEQEFRDLLPLNITVRQWRTDITEFALTHVHAGGFVDFAVEKYKLNFHMRTFSHIMTHHEKEEMSQIDVCLDSIFNDFIENHPELAALNNRLYDILQAQQEIRNQQFNRMYPDEDTSTTQNPVSAAIRDQQLTTINPNAVTPTSPGPVTAAIRDQQLTTINPNAVTPTITGPVTSPTVTGPVTPPTVTGPVTPTSPGHVTPTSPGPVTTMIRSQGLSTIEPTVNQELVNPSSPINKFGLSGCHFVCLGSIINLPYIRIILYSLATWFDICFSTVITEVMIFAEPALQLYKLYKLPSRIMSIYSLLVRFYNYIKNNYTFSFCLLVVFVIATCILFTFSN